jgi:hypothetical protein
MRFYLDSTPDRGDTRKLTKFAYFPTRVDNVIIWLESYIVYQEYTQLYTHFGDPFEYGWVETDRFLCDRTV